MCGHVFDDWFGMDQPKVTAAPQAPVQVVSSRYSSWDQGKTWQLDPNVHFIDPASGQMYYVGNQAEISDKSKWQVDTLGEWHSSYDEGAVAAQQESLYNEQMSLMAEQKSLAAQQAQALADEEARRLEEEAAMAENTKRRLALAVAGRRSTILGGTAEDNPTVGRRTLLGS